MRSAWFGVHHPAESLACPTCGAPAHVRCRSMVPTFGGGAAFAAIGAPIEGLHLERVAAGIAQAGR